RLACRGEQSELAAEAVAGEEERVTGKASGELLRERGQVDLDDLPVAEVRAAPGAQAALALPAQVGERDDRGLAAGERAGEGLVVGGLDAHRRQRQEDRQAFEARGGVVDREREPGAVGEGERDAAVESQGTGRRWLVGGHSRGPARRGAEALTL